MKGHRVRNRAGLSYRSCPNIRRAGFGLRYDTLLGENEHAVSSYKAIMYEHALRRSNPLRSYLHSLLPFLPAASRYNTAVERVHVMHHRLATMCTSASATGAGHMAAAFYSCSKAADPDSGFSYNEIMSDAALALFASFDTTGHSAAWLLYDLARNPEAQRRVRDELDQAGLLIKQVISMQPVIYNELLSHGGCIVV